MRPAAALRILACAWIAICACRDSRAWPPQPVTLYGEESCAHCRMIVSDERFGVQLHDRNGNYLVFDDIGCFLGHTRREEVDPAGVFVRSFADGSWLPAPSTFVVHAKKIQSPMGYGFAAYANRQQAEADAVKYPSSRVLLLPEVILQTDTFSGDTK